MYSLPLWVGGGLQGDMFILFVAYSGRLPASVCACWVNCCWQDGGSMRWYVYFICCVQWQVAGECLRVLSKLLGEYEVVGEDFGEDYVEVQMGGVVPAHKSPGYIIMLHMLKDSHFLSTVSLIWWCHFLSIISLTQLIVSPPVCS